MKARCSVEIVSRNSDLIGNRRPRCNCRNRTRRSCIPPPAAHPRQDPHRPGLRVSGAARGAGGGRNVC